MKNIKEVLIWNNGIQKKAISLNVYAVNVSLNNSATFWYGLYSLENDLLISGNLTMSNNDYSLWNNDEYVWEWVANKLNLTFN